MIALLKTGRLLGMQRKPFSMSDKLKSSPLTAPASRFGLWIGRQPDWVLTVYAMVAAFGGYDLIMEAYKEAMKEKYKFYSYGDAMLII